MYSALAWPIPARRRSLSSSRSRWEHGARTPRAGLEHGDAVVVDLERLLVRRRPLARSLGGEQAGVTLAGAVHPLELLECEHRVVRRSRDTTRRARRRSRPSCRSCAPASSRIRRYVAARRGLRCSGRARAPAGRRRPTSAIPRGTAARRCGSPGDRGQHGIAVLRVADREAEHVAEAERAVVAEHREPSSERARHDRGKGPVPGRARARVRRGSARSSRRAARGPAPTGRRALCPRARAARAGRRPDRSGAARPPAA